MGKKGILSLALIFLVLLSSLFLFSDFIFVNSKNHSKDNRITYTVKPYENSTYRGVYKSHGYVDLQDINSTNLLVRDGENVFKGEKLTSDGIYSPLNGIFSKQNNGYRVYQNIGEVVFYVSENDYYNFKLGDKVRLREINNSLNGEGTIAEIAKQPINNSDYSMSKYRIVVQVQDQDKYTFGEHLLISLDNDYVRVPKKYNSNGTLIVRNKNGKWNKLKITPVKTTNSEYVYDAKDLPVGTEVSDD